MEKYVCDVCGYVYDPAKGDHEHGIALEPSLKTCPPTGSALSAASAKTASASSKPVHGRTPVYVHREKYKAGVDGGAPI